MAEAKVETDEPGSGAERPRGYVSERGPFEIWENPEIRAPFPSEKVDPAKAGAGFAIDELSDKYGEEPVRAKVGEMVKAFSSGAATTPLFAQQGPNGMNLVHVWFGPNFPLFRHSHPRYGDCLYYVVAGEIVMGRRRLGPGSGFFVPNGMPYKYRAGADGVELLEFRAGGGDPEAPGMKLDEHSMGSIQKIIDGANEHRDSWEAPKMVGDTAYRVAARRAATGAGDTVGDE